MTWSIVARDTSGALGVIVASRFFAVGALCPHAHSGIGALSTQALVNPLYGPRGLAWLAQGIAPAEVVRSLILADAGREHRQVHLIDAEGKIAAHTGAECIDWCGHVIGEGFSVAGNMLSGPQVIERTAEVYDAARERPFGGQRRGGSRKRGGTPMRAARGTRPQDVVRGRSRRALRGRRRELHARRRPHVMHRRRIRLRQERYCAVDHGTHRHATGTRQRRDTLRGCRPHAAFASRDARAWRW